MNAHAKLLFLQAGATPEVKLISDAGRTVNLAFSLGACRTPEEADHRADTAEAAALAMSAGAAQPSNEVHRLEFMELAGDYAQRARLYRDRARELRG